MRIQILVLSVLAAFGCVDKDDGNRDLSPFLDSDQDGFPEAHDCNDKDPSIHPEAVEMCDGIDNDCDGVQDEDDAYDAPDWYLDQDGDGFGSAENMAPGCEPPVGYVDTLTDCDDLDSSSYPGAVEMCDLADNDCDGTIDEGTAYDAITWFGDNDADKFGSFFDQIRSCEQPETYVCVTTGTDNPCADRCDNDLDGLIDEEDEDCTGFDPATWADYNTEVWLNTEVRYWDYNGDGGLDFDCNDNVDTINPGEPEQCDEDDIDENCDQLIDDEDPDAVGMIRWFADMDNDAYGTPEVSAQACDQPEFMVDNEDDCDDENPLVNPDNAEICGDGVDNNCDGETDEEGAPFPLQWYRDFDGDDYGDPGHTWGSPQCAQPPGYVQDATDCNDFNDDINPGAEEVWYNGTDENCDDNDCDQDEDGYFEEGDPDCAHLGGDDCEDTDPMSHPDAPEVCGDGVNNDCDGAEDDPCDVDGIVVGSGAFDRAGASVSMGGDVDGDGKDDILIGASRYNGDGLSKGGAFLISGSGTSVSSVDDADAIMVGEADHDRAGSSVAIVGDTNGDGFDDMLVGAYGEDAGGAMAGAAYLLLGPVSGELDLGTAHAKLAGEIGDDYAGYNLASGGDANGDGFADLLVGAYGNDLGGTASGAAYLVYGPLEDEVGEDPSCPEGSLHGVCRDLSYANVQFVGHSGGEESGFSVASAGDFNGDGLDDTIIGAPNAAQGAAYVGATYLILSDDEFEGSLDLTDADARFVGINGGDQAGYSVHKAGDMNGDGKGDIIIGAPGHDAGGADSGAAFIIFGGTSHLCPAVGFCESVSLSVADAKLVGERGDDFAGGAVSGGGDLDNDDIPDVVVGARIEDSGNSDAGAAYAVLGPLSGTVDLSAADGKVIGETTGDWAGGAVATGGDLDNDGSADILVGAPQYDAGDSVDIGAVYIVLGGGW